MDHIYDDMVVRNAKVNIILPEHSLVRQIHTPYPVSSQSDGTHSTYLDTAGRPMITLRAHNLVENHIEDIEIEYEFSKSYLGKEPLLVAGALVSLFLTVMICVRLDFTLTKSGEKSK